MQTERQMIIVGGNPDPVDDVLKSQEAIRKSHWWEGADIAEHWPLTGDEAAQLLSLGGQFDVDAEGLRDLIERKLLSAPGVNEAGEAEWSAADVMAASRALQWRQQWRATPSFHDMLKHPCQLVLERAREAGEVAEITRGNPNDVRYDVRHLLVSLQRCDEPQGRAIFIALLKATLEVEHGVIIQ